MSKRFGTFVALDQISMRVPTGSMHALLGEHGAGKSTVLTPGEADAVLGLLHTMSRQGRVTVLVIIHGHLRLRVGHAVRVDRTPDIQLRLWPVQFPEKA
jgi:ABC-type uncharacterized transport system ATPase subunit